MADVELVWYAAYGSNLHLPRLSCYLEGGCPPGASRDYTGARDTTPPREVTPVQLPGSLRFGGESPVWGGGVAVLEPTGDGPVAATAYLLTREQVCDVVAQETHQECGAVTDLDAAPGGTGWYDDLVRTEHVGRPLYALASTSPPPANPPGATYVSMMARGLMATRGWSLQQCTAYLSGVRGMPRAAVPFAWPAGRTTQVVSAVTSRPTSTTGTDSTTSPAMNSAPLALESKPS